MTLEKVDTSLASPLEMRVEGWHVVCDTSELASIFYFLFFFCCILIFASNVKLLSLMLSAKSVTVI